MGKLIDSDLLRKEINHRKNIALGMQKSGVGFTRDNPVLAFAVSEYDEALSLIDSLAEESEFDDMDLELAKDMYKLVEVQRKSSLSDEIEKAWNLESLNGEKLINDKDIFECAMRNAYCIGYFQRDAPNDPQSPEIQAGNL